MAAAVTAATSGGTFANDATVGTIAWDTPSNASASDDTRASAVLLITEISKYLKATNFGFNIPAGSTIRGIVVEVEKSSATGVTIEDNSVKIVQDGTIGGTEQKVAGAWPTTDAYTTYGSATDLWGLTWTSSQINSVNFGVVVACDATAAGTGRIDHIRITIHYTDLQLNFVQNYNFQVGQGVTISAATMSFFGFNFLGSISFNTMNFVMTNAVNTTMTASYSLGLYSLNGATLFLANSISASTTLTNNARYFVSLTGTSATQNITPGTWYWGFLASLTGQSTNQTSAIILGAQSVINPTNAFPGGFIWGRMTDSTNALPSSYATSDLDITGQDALSVPGIILSA